MLQTEVLASIPLAYAQGLSALVTFPYLRLYFFHPLQHAIQRMQRGAAALIVVERLRNAGQDMAGFIYSLFCDLPR